ncbi:MAG TPA: hypothetical protein ENH41_03420 [Candidatus Omnitrophica bacterium]|nr:hypothetical protein [Candidatus Omnitrophota bacterium]
MIKFEEFLQDRHGAQYIGTDDMMPDDFNDWLEDLSIDEWINYGNMFANLQESEGLKKRIAELEQEQEREIRKEALKNES